MPMHRTSAETSMRPDRSHEGLQGQKTRPYVADYAPGLRPRPNTPGYSSGPEHPRTSALVGGRLQRGQIAEHFRRCQGRRAISKKNYGSRWVAALSHKPFTSFCCLRHVSPAARGVVQRTGGSLTCTTNISENSHSEGQPLTTQSWEGV